MTKKFKCEVDCANCALRMEDAAKKVEGVEDVSINFMTQKLTLTAPSENYDRIFMNVLKVCKKIDSDFCIL